MKWEKIGMIFDCSVLGLNYAKSPQALVFNDYVRIYFSTCYNDGNKLISVVKYVDFNKNFTKIINYSEHEVISRGELGCFDEHGIFPFSPLRYNDQIFGYTSGWSRRQSVSVETGIGLTISFDNGNTFNRIGKGPVLTASLQEPFLVVDGYVLPVNNILHMWYIYGTEWKKFDENAEPERLYKIGHATSVDGVNWIKDGIQLISDKLEYEAQALPTVINIDNVYHMYFCYREANNFRTDKKRSYRIGYAYSNDLKTWTRDDDVAGIDISLDGWDSDMICYPNLFELEGTVYMLYNGNSFGKYGFGLAKLEEL